MSNIDKVSNKIEALLSKMTLKEKVGQLNQHMYGWNAYKRVGNDIELTDAFKEEVRKFDGMGALYGFLRADPWSAVTYETGITAKMAPKAVNKLQRYVIENTRLGIPLLLPTECPHGHQALDGYLLPSVLAMASTFHPSMIKEGFSVCAKQMKASGINTALVSLLDMLIDPRWGRSEESFGEDPYLAARMAEAVVKGCQGELYGGRFGEYKLAAVAKHLCAQGDGSGGINANPSKIGERELHEIHLMSMQACCQANVMGCMAAYNEIDGVPCNANKHLLTDILRDEFGFDGIVMADGYAVAGLNNLTGDAVKSGAMALSAGVDLSLWDDEFTYLEKAVRNGYVSEEEIDRAVRRVLKLKFRLGLFDNPYVDENDKTSEMINYKNNPSSLEIARESIILLENRNNILPLNHKIKKIAIIGPNADHLYNQLGDYTPPIASGNGITVLEGIRSIVSPDTNIAYAKGCGIRNRSKAGFEEALSITKDADVVILVLGSSSTRDFDVKFDKTGAALPSENPTEMDCGEGVDVADLHLGGVQEELAHLLYDTGKPVITVLVQGRPHAVEEISKRTTALLCSFYPGPMGGQAIAEVLFGQVSPSGHLPVSVPRSSAQLPVYYNHKDTGSTRRYMDMEKKPLYPFGYGKSYSDFRYSDLAINPDRISATTVESGNSIQVNVKVTNVGGRASFAVPQLYIRDLEASVTRRVRELKGFKKVWLEAGESKIVEFSVGKDDLALWNLAMQFVVEPGTVRFFCGDDCNAELSADFLINA